MPLSVYSLASPWGKCSSDNRALFLAPVQATETSVQLKNAHPFFLLHAVISLAACAWFLSLTAYKHF